jgi:hypothetical protein
VTSAVTPAGVTSHRVTSHGVTAHGMTAHGVTTAMTSAMSSREGSGYRHATEGDCGGESNQCTTKHLTLHYD